MAEIVGYLSFPPRRWIAKLVAMWRGMRFGTHIAICLIALAFTQPVLPESSFPVREAFSKIQKLAGKWKGTDERGQVVESEFVPVASNTAVMETLDMAG